MICVFYPSYLKDGLSIRHFCICECNRFPLPSVRILYIKAKLIEQYREDALSERVCLFSCVCNFHSHLEPTYHRPKLLNVTDLRALLITMCKSCWWWKSCPYSTPEIRKKTLLLTKNWKRELELSRHWKHGETLTDYPRSTSDNVLKYYIIYGNLCFRLL